MSRWRVLHTEASCGWGGQELRVLAEVRGMSARGHDVWIAAPFESRIYQEALGCGMQVAALPLRRKSVAGLLALRAFLKKHQFDVVNTHSSTDAWLTALASLAWRDAPPMVRTRHISAPIPRNALSSWIYRRAAAQVVTTGEALRQQVVTLAGVDPQRARSVPTGVDLSQFAPGDRASAREALGLPAEAFIVAIVATLRSWKGHQFLVDAIARIEDARLLIVGDGPGRENLEQQVAGLDLSERVRFAGQQADVVPWMRAADVACLPSFANEGVPQALMQAMACGLPIVTTHVGAIAEIVEDGVEGLIVAPRDVESLVEALERLRRDPVLRQQLGQAGLARARQRFSMDSMLDGMEAVYERALQGHAGRRVAAIS
jgi:glycosyltransferase involved in cell wall biosynthesis